MTALRLGTPRSFEFSYVLPDFPANTTWLKPNERAYILARLADDHNADSAEEMSIGRLKALKMAVSDWRMWLFCFGQSLIAAAGSVSFFIPTLVTSLGYTGSMAQYVSDLIPSSFDSGPPLTSTCR